MRQYHNILKLVLDKGDLKNPARENMPKTKSLFGHQERFHLSEGFPLVTTKKMYWKGIVCELLWFLRGDTNIKFLDQHGVRKMWHEDAYNFYLKTSKRAHPSGKTPYTFEEFCQVIAETPRESLPRIGDYVLGDCGYQYGKVWRNLTKLETLEPVDQIKNCIQGILANPESRRHVVSAIDPTHDEDLALYWCHSMFQFNCAPIPDDKREYAHGGARYFLDLQMFQRSADLFLGVPLNIASYTLLQLIVAKICNMVSRTYIHTFGDAHIYGDHLEQVDELLKRDVSKYPLPTVSLAETIDWDYIRKTCDFSKLKVEDFILENYQSYPAITAKLSTGLR